MFFGVSEGVRLQRQISKDLVSDEGSKTDEIIELNKPEEIVLVELKTTKKKHINLPYGFFFGATESEFSIATQLGEAYRFCFVSLHEDSKGFVMLTLDQLNKIIKKKRIQYQINL